MVNNDIERLETLVELRRKEAIKKDLGEKVLIVSNVLGKKEYCAREHYLTTYSKENLEVSLNLNKTQVSVNYKEKLVFAQDFSSHLRLKDWLNVRAYIPGDWEKELDEAYEKALKLINYRKRRNYVPRRKYLREAFAL